jgi:hypothetical protein
MNLIVNTWSHVTCISKRVDRKRQRSLIQSERLCPGWRQQSLCLMYNNSVPRLGWLLVVYMIRLIPRWLTHWSIYSYMSSNLKRRNKSQNRHGK